MEKIKIITDSASDISLEDEKRYGIDVMPFTIAFGEEVYTSRVDYDNEKLITSTLNINKRIEI